MTVPGTWPQRWFCVGALILFVFGIWQCLAAAGGDAPDFRVYQAGIEAQRAGEDPYRIETIRRYGAAESLSYVYPPLMRYGLAPLVDLDFDQAAIVYAACLAIACGLLAWVFVPRRGVYFVGLAAFAATGFAAARWNFQTGNLGLVELLLFAVACIALHRRRLMVFAVFIGLLAFIKVLPLAFTVLLVPLVRRQRAPAHALLWPAVAWLTLHAVSFALQPELTKSWWLALTGGVAGQHTPLQELASGNNNPTFVLMLLDLVRLEPGVGAGDVTMLVLVAVAAWIAMRAALLLWRSDRVAAAMPLATLAVLLCWPRMKPYSYGYALVAVVIGAAALTPRRALLLLAGLGALPAVMPWLPNLPVDALQLLKRNHLAVLLLAAGVVLAWPDARRSAR